MKGAKFNEPVGSRSLLVSYILLGRVSDKKFLSIYLISSSQYVPNGDHFHSIKLQVSFRLTASQESRRRTKSTHLLHLRYFVLSFMDIYQARK